MRPKNFKAALINWGLAASVLLLASGASVAQTVVNLTAGPATAYLPDGSAVPMWGYSCTAGGTAGACSALNPAVAAGTAAAGTWSPVVITVATGQSLTINLTNNLSFTPSGATTPNNIPTSITIIGQLGGGLGSPTTAASPPHNTQSQITWSTATVLSPPAGFTPPPQNPRVQSFATEVQPGAGATALVWTAPAPGTYLIESGTHPSIQGPMGLYGILVVTTAPSGASAGTAYGTPGAPNAVSYNTEVPLIFGEIDPVQNQAVQTAVNTAGFAETTVWSGLPGGCGNPGSPVGVINTCYPPAVNYLPVYYTINGVAFSRTNVAGSTFPTTLGTAALPVSGTALVRLVNAGLKMHVPSMVGSVTNGVDGTGAPAVVGGFTLVGEDGNALPPAAPRVQTEIFMAAGKTFDVLVNVPAAGSPALPIFDRELSLSGNQIERDAGMLAYISVNGAAAPASSSSGAASAVADVYNSIVAGQTLTVGDPSKGVIANDTNVYGVRIVSGGVAVSGPVAGTNGTLTLNTNGTFTYVANATAPTTGQVDQFTYCGNGTLTGAACTTLTLNSASIESSSAINCTGPIAFNASIATYLAIKTPGVLATCTDAAGLPLTVDPATIVNVAGTTSAAVLADANGGFTANAAGAGTASFTFEAMNTQGVHSAPVSVGLTFPAGGGLNVTVLDGYDKSTTISDYRWIIEEDRTFYINPNCVQNPPPAGCPTAAAGIVPTLGVNFHTSYMPYVAQGCTGPMSCEAGQMMLDTRPACTAPGVPAGCSATAGTHINAVCDVGNGVCRPDTVGNGLTAVMPGSVALDPTKRYYISVLPGDAANPFISGFTGIPCGQPNADPSTCVTGHGMGGAPIAAAVSCATSTTGVTTCTGTSAAGTAVTCSPATGSSTCVPAGAVTAASVTVLTQPSPYPPADLSVFVYEDDFPLNGEQDGGGGVDVLSPIEPGLGGFQIHLWDAMGGNGDFTGQMTYDMFNQPLGNSLDGTIDPVTQLNACPITAQASGITGMIVTCPKYESDGKTLSPLAGQAVIKNLMPGRFGVIATPGADRIARGEEWLQTNTLDGQKAHDSFARIGEPNYFQEFGPAGFHVSIGFANPAIINARKPFVCAGSDPNLPGGYSCKNTLTGMVTGQRLSRTPDERLYESGSHDAYAWTQCYVSFGDPDGEDFAFTKCNADGTFTLVGLPDGDWRVTTFDQWNDQLVDGLSTPVRLGSTTQKCPGPTSTLASAAGAGGVCDMGHIAATQWETNLYTRTFVDDNQDGVAQSSETGIPFANVAVRLRDGSLENLLLADFTGAANFNETFPLFAWYTVETDVTRYKNTGTHVVYDVGGPADGTNQCGNTGAPGYPPCDSGAVISKYLANTVEMISLPTNLRVPGSVYCAGADCSGKSIQNGPSTSDPPSSCTTATTPPYATSCSTTLSSGRIDNPWLGGVEGWQGFPGQSNWIEFGKAPYIPGENGGIEGHVIYASTRPFDDPQMLVQTQWEPLVPHVRINLYQEGFAADGVTPTLTLVDTTTTTSWDDWAQGFHLAADGVTKVPNMNCPGQGANTGTLPDLFYYSLYNQPQYLDFYNNVQHGTAGTTALPANSQYKCYDGMHNWNQIQPAPYDGMYQFPSVTALDPTTGKPAGTNCTICSNKGTANAAPNLPTSDLYYGTPQLPPGKYVVEVVLPQGYELVKEEDKNILIGDNYIAPAAQQFGGLGNVFILPDQASVASAYTTPGIGFNANTGQNGNGMNPTQSLGTSPNNGIVPGFVPEPTWPCVGEARIVPDYISLYPQSKQMSPFAGATRRLCDRKEVTLTDQAHSIAKFYVYTSTHIASKFTGGITDDYTSEFDPFSPQFGEKFAPPDLPVSVKDWTGSETNRVYADHWGAYNGMTYSTWEVNPPNPTGYAPTMMVVCMNDPGPIAGPNGTQITDPLFTQGYSQFCYELPFMPGTTQYLDTPVVPTSAFAGAGYNNVDCAYPDATPAVAEVDGDGVGPWVSASGHTLTITSLGDQMVPNYAYSGPSANTAPYNQKTVKRHFGFGGTAGTVALVGSDGVAHPLTGVTWTDGKITGVVPGGLTNCPIQQQAQYKPSGTSTALCGQLVITTSAGKQSVDAVTVTIGGKAPTHIAASASIQAAIDAAAPGDLLMIDPTCNSAAGVVACTAPGVTGKTVSAHNEILLMWKPVRLQGVGAASSILNANTHPAGKLDAWRRSVNCLFGLSMSGQPATVAGGSNPYDSPTDNNGNPYTCPYGAGVGGATGPNGNLWRYFVGTAMSGSGSGTVYSAPQVDRLPLEAIVGWDATQNGNLAEQLQEPSLMGALEGAGITVLAKGVRFPRGQDPFGSGAGELGSFPTGSTLLTNNRGTGLSGSGTLTVGDANSVCTSGSSGSNPYPSNFVCNPSSIDGLTITDSSQGGGGVFVHAWGHYLQIANNRIINNAGTLSGGINVGQGEFPPSYISGSATNAPPGSCEANAPNNVQMPYCHNVDVNIHHNYVAGNSSTGDELFSATPAGAGGVSICTGADYYKFNYNWVCGNLSSGDGGGFGHIGFSYNGDIEHNTFIFNQSVNPTIPANGGGLIVMGAPDADPPCGAQIDIDCVPPLGSVGPSDGIGPNLVINANLIMGNSADSGSGGGIAFQNVNGSEVLAFPNNPNRWYSPRVTNNIIADNVAGWDGAGVSLVDALNIDIINNTIVSNTSTASAGPLFTTIGGPLSSSAGGGNPASNNCMTTSTTSCPQVAGLVSIQNSATLVANINQLPVVGGGSGAHRITCPTGHYAGGKATDGTCLTASYPLMYNNAFWQNSSYYIGVGALSAQFQQNVISLYNAFTSTLAPSQSATDGTTANTTGGVTVTGGTGACTAASFWDIGVRGDTGPTNHGSGVTLQPAYSLLTSTAGYTTTSTGAAANNTATNPGFASQYCNGSRQPPEACSATGGCGWAVPPGIADATVPNPVFNLTPVATVDEGNNWVNMRWGPLSLTNPTALGTDGNYGGGAALGNYSLAATTSGAYNAGTGAEAGVAAPSSDFFGTQRPQAGAWDIGAVEFVGPTVSSASVAPTTLTFASRSDFTTSPAQTVTVTNTGTTALTGGTFTFTGPYSRPAGFGGGTCGANLAIGANCTINVVFRPTAVGANNGTLAVAYTGVTVTGSPVTLNGTGTARGLLEFTGATNGTLAANGLGFQTLTFTIPSPRAAVTSVVTVTNGGTGAMTVSAPVLAINLGGLYSITANNCPATGAGLAPAATCTFSVRYATPATAPRFADGGLATVNNTGATSPATLGLSAQ